MVDPKLHERFTRRSTDAAFGYGTAATEAYFALAGQVLDFWANVLSSDAPARPQTKRAATTLPVPAFGWPATQASTAVTPFWAAPAPAAQTMVDPFAIFAAWANAFAGPTAAAPYRASPQLPFANPFQMSAFQPWQNPWQAWLGATPFAAATPAWPMAFMMIAYGMPSSVAWPAAEANVAVIEAADAAAGTVRQAFSSYRTDGGHSARQWEPAQLMMLAAFLPMGLGAMLAQVRIP